jgi:hydroxyethylthiazole kinase-like sugar kinase family protein
MASHGRLTAKKRERERTLAERRREKLERRVTSGKQAANSRVPVVYDPYSVHATGTRGSGR